MTPFRAFSLSAATAALLIASPLLPAQPAQWQSRGPGGGGAFYNPSISPQAGTAKAFVASDMSGVYQTTDFGATWTMLDHRALEGSSRAGRVAYTCNANVLYALQGANDLCTPVKSVDFGATWAALGADPTGGGAFSLHADPGSDQRLVVTDYSRVFFSSNGGASFAQVFSSSVAGAGCHVPGVLWDGAKIYIGTDVGIVASTDGGTSFSVLPASGIPSTEAIVGFAGAKQGATTRFVAVTLGRNDVYAGVTGDACSNFQHVYTMDAGAGTWTERNLGIAQGTYPFFAGMAANNTGVVWLAGGSDNGAPVVWRSTDGGASFPEVFHTANNQNIATGWAGSGGDFAWSYPEYPLGFAVGPADASRAMITDLGCVHVTVDGGTSWRQAYLRVADQNAAGAPTPKGRAYRGNGLENTSCWQLAWTDSTHLIAAITDIRGARSDDGGASWSFDYSGHTLNTMYRVVRHPATGVLYAATSSVHDLYQSTYLTDARINPLGGATGRVLASTDGGHVWTTIMQASAPVVSVACDSAHPTRVYAAVAHYQYGGFLVSNDVQKGISSTWTALAAPARAQGHPYNLHILRDGSLLATYSGRRAGSPQAFTASSGVFLSTDGGASWLDRSAPQMLYWTKDVTVDPSDPTESTWYAGVFSGWGGPPNGLGGLYRTVDRGLAWTKILALDRVESCSFRPDSPKELYVTTEVDGLWYTPDAGAATPQFSRVASYPFRHPMRVFFHPTRNDELWVTSFGGGLFTGTAARVPVAFERISAARTSEGVELRWRTARETNNAGFEVQRRAPADAAWQAVATVAPAGDGSAPADYACTDAAAPAGRRLQYRVKQTDFDGRCSYSPVAEVDAAAARGFALRGVAPQPARSSAALRLASDRARTLLLRVVDALGRVADVARHEIPAGESAIALPVARLVPGMYTVSVADGDTQLAVPLLIAR